MKLLINYITMIILINIFFSCRSVEKTIYTKKSIESWQEINSPQKSVLTLRYKEKLDGICAYNFHSVYDTISDGLMMRCDTTATFLFYHIKVTRLSNKTYKLATNKFFLEKGYVTDFYYFIHMGKHYELTSYCYSTTLDKGVFYLNKEMSELIHKELNSLFIDTIISQVGNFDRVLCIPRKER